MESLSWLMHKIANSCDINTSEVIYVQFILFVFCCRLSSEDNWFYTRYANLGFENHHISFELCFKVWLSSSSSPQRSFCLSHRLVDTALVSWWQEPVDCTLDWPAMELPNSVPSVVPSRFPARAGSVGMVCSATWWETANCWFPVLPLDGGRCGSGDNPLNV